MDDLSAEAGHVIELLDHVIELLVEAGIRLPPQWSQNFACSTNLVPHSSQNLGVVTTLSANPATAIAISTIRPSLPPPGVGFGSPPPFTYPGTSSICVFIVTQSREHGNAS